MGVRELQLADIVWARNFGHSTLLATLQTRPPPKKIMSLFSFFSLPTVLISKQRHSNIYWWISKSCISKDSCCDIEYDTYDKIYIWRISIVYFTDLDFVKKIALKWWKMKNVPEYFFLGAMDGQFLFFCVCFFVCYIRYVWVNQGKTDEYHACLPKHSMKLSLRLILPRPKKSKK